MFIRNAACVLRIAGARADRAQNAAADLGALSVEGLVGDLSADDWVGEFVGACVATTLRRFPGDNAQLHALAVLTDVAEAVRCNIDDLVIGARIAGASWSDIGRQLGMSQQAAYERWA
ncbi:hypothetical protein [Mycolicibacterium sphagni]|uniref:hypothetical protein n=1 Tax=Mycolicibacterium sphagni TaxID=1786 RepID=UPI0021F35A63|nr:hypothetical protein [Mycolicibacterium sphagni]MCV7178925.1 hypothetical protein [Mycolicibacterium sphagni]